MPSASAPHKTPLAPVLAPIASSFWLVGGSGCASLLFWPSVWAPPRRVAFQQSGPGLFQTQALREVGAHLATDAKQNACCELVGHWPWSIENLTTARWTAKRGSRPVGSGVQSDSQALAAFGATCIDHGATTAGLHANQESMRAGTARFRGLVSAFHLELLRKYRENLGLSQKIKRFHAFAHYFSAFAGACFCDATNFFLPVAFLWINF
jgi:hypothetical protein